MKRNLMKLSAEEQSIVETVRNFVGKDVKPVAQHLDHTNTYPEDPHRHDEGDGRLRPGSGERTAPTHR